MIFLVLMGSRIYIFDISKQGKNGKEMEKILLVNLS